MEVEFRKGIKVAEGKIIYMTFEECQKYFKKMVYGEIAKFKGKVFNALEEEDLKQELDIELWRAYQKYDLELKTCFSTFLHFRLEKGTALVIKKVFAKKRDSNGILHSMEAENEEGLSMYDLQYDNSTSSIESDLCAKKMYDCMISYCKNEKEKELLDIILFKQSKLKYYAKRHDITPQAASRQVQVMRQRLQFILLKNNFY